MKKNTIIKMSLLTALSISGMNTALLANDKMDLISADQTLAKSERKVVMGMSQLGLEKNNFSFPVYYTPAGKNAKTVKIGEWDVTLPQSFANAVLEENYSLLIPNRYDKLIFGQNNAKILTATKDVEVSTSELNPFETSLTSYETFKFDTLRYLNTEIAPKITPVLSAAKDARYSEMNEQESQTFITTKANEVGMPASVLQSLVSSAYSFSLYMPELSGTISISQHIYKDSKGRTITSYSTTLNAPITLQLAINKLNAEKFDTTGEISSEANNKKSNFLSNMFNRLAKQSSGSGGISTPFMPSEKNAQGIFEQVFAESFKDNMIALGTRLKEDRNFAIVAPLNEVSGSSAKLSVGNQEDIRVDHPFKIFRTENGEEKFIGIVKIRKAGDNCLLLPQENRTLSEGSLISGSTIEEADLAVEHPWTGVFGSVLFENNMGTYTYDSTETDTGSSNNILLGFNADLGYVLNKAALSEVWMNMYLGFGSGNFDKLPEYDAYYEFKATGDNSIAIKLKMGLEKRFYIAKGLYASGAVDMDYEIQSYSYESAYTSDDGSLSIGTFSVTPEARIGYLPNPNLDFFASVGYNLPLVSSASFTYGEDNEVTVNEDYTKEAALNIKLGVNVHVDFAGPFAKMFKRPSSRCDALKQ